MSDSDNDSISSRMNILASTNDNTHINSIIINDSIHNNNNNNNNNNNSIHSINNIHSNIYVDDMMRGTHGNLQYNAYHMAIAAALGNTYVYIQNIIYIYIYIYIYIQYICIHIEYTCICTQYICI